MYTFRKVFANVYTGLHDPTHVHAEQNGARTEFSPHSSHLQSIPSFYLSFYLLLWVCTLQYRVHVLAESGDKTLHHR